MANASWVCAILDERILWNNLRCSWFDSLPKYRSGVVSLHVLLPPLTLFRLLAPIDARASYILN